MFSAFNPKCALNVHLNVHIKCVHLSVHTWSSGQPTVQLPAGAGIRTHNLRLPRVSSPTLYPLGQRLPTIPKRFPELDAFCKQRLFQTKMIR